MDDINQSKIKSKCYNIKKEKKSLRYLPIKLDENKQAALKELFKDQTFGDKKLIFFCSNSMEEIDKSGSNTVENSTLSSCTSTDSHVSSANIKKQCSFPVENTIGIKKNITNNATETAVNCSKSLKKMGRSQIKILRRKRNSSSVHFSFLFKLLIDLFILFLG